MAFDLVTIIVITLAVLCIIELGLTAYVADGFFAGHTHSSVSFMVFNSVWSLLVLAYIGLTPKFLPQAFHKLVALGLLAVTTIFWFAGSIAAAARLGVPPGCSSDSRCASFQAFIAFGFFIWALFTGLTVLAGLDFQKNRAGGGPTEMTNQKPAAEPYAGV